MLNEPGIDKHEISAADPINQLQIVIHQFPKCIQVGKSYQCYPDLYVYQENKQSRKDSILKRNSITLPTFDSAQQISLFYCLHLGGKFNRRFQNISYALWVGDDSKLIQRFCRYGRSLSNDLVYRFHLYRDLIMASVRNNEVHLIPAILFFGAGVSAIKAGLGNALWKTLCKNSASRNHLIFTCAAFTSLQKFFDVSNSYTEHKAPTVQPMPVALIKPIIELLIELPSGILGCIHLHRALDHIHCDIEYDYAEDGNMEVIDAGATELEILMFFVIIAKAARHLKKITDSDFIRAALQTIKDCRRMAQRLNQPFNSTWSFNRMEREHKSLTQQYNAVVYEHYYQDYNFDIPWIRELHYHGITATLLCSRAALIIEGDEMRHCVGSYDEMVERGRSLIFSLKNTLGKRSTLELKVGTNGKVKLNQHRMFQNDPVEDPDFSEAAKYILATQSKVLRESFDSPGASDELVAMTFIFPKDTCITTSPREAEQPRPLYQRVLDCLKI